MTNVRSYADINSVATTASIRLSQETVCVSGGFDPLHVGHCALLEAASKYGALTVILNSDPWLIEKKGYRVMNWDDRATILRNVRAVSQVLPVDDADRTICEALRRIRPRYFAKSGDRQPDSMPKAELDVCKELGIEILYNVCPHLPYSSSQIISHRRPRDEAVWKSWGSYEVLEHHAYPNPPNWKVKRLDIAPGQRISLQRHEHHQEHWVIVRGRATVRVREDQTFHEPGSYIYIPLGEWHQIINSDPNMPLTLVEVQLGRTCEESDIDRADEPKVKEEFPSIKYVPVPGRVEGDV